MGGDGSNIRVASCAELSSDIEQIEGEIKELTEGKKEIFLEAKSNGFDVKIIREVIRLRKEDDKEREERESLLDLYLQAMKGSRVAKAA